MSNPKIVLKDQISSGRDYITEVLELLDEDLFRYSSDEDSRTFGEIVLHLIRSYEYYLNGIYTDSWKALPYTIEEYDSVVKVKDLFDQVKSQMADTIQKIDRQHLHTNYDTHDTNAFGLNLIVELLQHQSHHIGQLSIYLRLNDIEPPQYNFLV